MGIWPTDGMHIMKSITRAFLASSPQKPGAVKIPKTARAIRRFHAVYNKSLTVDKVKTLFSTTLHLSAQVTVLRRETGVYIMQLSIKRRKVDRVSG